MVSFPEFVLPHPSKKQWLESYTRYIQRIDDELAARGYRRILTGEDSPLMERKVPEDRDEVEADVFLAMAVAKMAGLEDPWACLEGRVVSKPKPRVPVKTPPGLEEYLDSCVHPWDL